MRLVIRYHDGWEEERVFETPVVRVGRDVENDLVLDTALISRQHCEIRLRDQKVYVCDLESMNGTFIDAKRIQGEVELGSSALAVGNVTIRVKT